MKKLPLPMSVDTNDAVNHPDGIVWTWQMDFEEGGRADFVVLEAMLAKKGTSTGPIPVVSRSQIKRLIEAGRVKVNGQTIKPSTQLQRGWVVIVEIERPSSRVLQPENRPLEILFEDDHLLVINKPPNLTVHPSPTQMEGTLVQILLHHVQHLSQVGGALRAGIVHRIDKNTSGALVISKTDEAHLKLIEIFAQHQIERRYWALCFGAPPVADGLQPTIEKWVKIESLLGRSEEDRRKMSMKVKTGRKAISYYRCVQRFAVPGKTPFASWMEVKLDTGRTHQVRVHLTSLGYSILGDPVYGTPTVTQAKWANLPNVVKKAVEQLPGQALHARVLSFVHPITQEVLRVEAEPPAEFAAVMRALQEVSFE